MHLKLKNIIVLRICYNKPREENFAEEIRILTVINSVEIFAILKYIHRVTVGSRMVNHAHITKVRLGREDTFLKELFSDTQ